MGIFEEPKEVKIEIPIKLKNEGKKKDGLDIYEYDNINEYNKFLQEGTVFYCPLCWKRLPESEQKKIFEKRISNYEFNVTRYYSIVDSEKIDIFNELYELASKIEENAKKAENLFYKHKCVQTNTEIYIKLYMPPYQKVKKEELRDQRYHYDIWRNNVSIKNQLLQKRKEEEEERERQREIRRREEEERRRREEEERERYRQQKEYCNGFRLCGKVQVVNSFPDFTVEVVESFPDLRVQKVSSSPSRIGEWEFVESFPDFKIQYVNSFADLKIQFVDSFPGY